MRKPFNLSLLQMKEIRRGILLAKHDYQLLSFEARHKDTDESIINDIVEVYESTEKLILGHADITDLTVEAYCRTLDGLRERNPLPDDQELE